MKIKVLYQMKCRFIKIEKFGTFFDGERINYHFLGAVEGDIVKGECRGINYEIKNGSRVNIHIHESITTHQGEKILIERVGSSQSISNSNEIKIRNGQVLARTNAERLGWINNTILFWDGDLLWDDRNFMIQVYEQ